MGKKIKTKNSKFTMSIAKETTVDDLANDISGYMDRDQLMRFIVALDVECCDWDFTIKLYQHFLAKRNEYISELDENNPTEAKDIEDLKKLKPKEIIL